VLAFLLRHLLLIDDKSPSVPLIHYAAHDNNELQLTGLNPRGKLHDMK